MTGRLVLVCGLVLGLLGGDATALRLKSDIGTRGGAAGSAGSITKSDVLDVLFPLDVPQQFLLKMVLRFDDSETQIVVVIYPDKQQYWVRRCDVTVYSVEGTETVSDLIKRKVQGNPDIGEREIAREARVAARTWSVPPAALDDALAELRAIQISPALTAGVVLDGGGLYDFWYDTGQAMVHYRISPPTGGSDDFVQDRLARWMQRFRAALPTLVKTLVTPFNR